MPTNTTPAVNPNVTRSRLVLEVASEMVGGTAADPVPDYFQAKVILRHNKGGKPVTLFAVSSAEGIFAVANREADLAMINPACVLSVAVKGKGIFKEPLPLRAVTVIPSWDQFVFAVRPETGITSFEEIAAKKPKLRIMMRGALDHTLHHMFDDGAVAAYADLQGADQRRGRCALRRSGAFLGAASSRCRHAYLVPQRKNGADARSHGLSPRDPAEVGLSEIAGRRSVDRFQRLDGVRARRRRRQDGRADLRRDRGAQDARAVGRAGRPAGRAHGARGDRHAPGRAAPPRRRTLLEKPRVSVGAFALGNPILKIASHRPSLPGLSGHP